MEVFKQHIMPKPQRRQKTESKSHSGSSETVKLTKEVKRIKLSRVNNQVQPMDCTPHNEPAKECDKGHKRTISDNHSIQNPNKRQRIQWP